MGQVQIIAAKPKLRVLADGTTLLNNQIRVAAYCRVSTENEEQATSFDNQVDEWTKRLSEDPKYILVGVYADKGISGTSEKGRVEFQRLINDAKAGKIDKIFTKSISRFARNVTLSITLTRELKQLGVEVYFDEEKLSSLDTQSEMVFTILASVAQEESRHTSENVKWTFERKMKQGEVFLCDATFLGYKKDPDNKKNLLIIPEEAETVRLIYKWYSSGIGTCEIVRRLETMGAKNGRGTTKWYQSTVEAILTNEKYCGDLLQQKSYTPDYLTHKRIKNTGQVQQYYVRDNHPAIVDRDTWDRVQLIFKRNRDKYIGENDGLSKYSYRYPLSGRCICAACGESYKRRHWISGYPEPRIFYQCNGFVNGKPKQRCKAHGLSEDILLEAVCSMINNLFLGEDEGTFDDILEVLKNKLKTSNVSMDLDTYENRREAVDEEITQLIKAKSGAKDNDEFYILDKKYRDKINEYKLITEKIKVLVVTKTSNEDIQNRLSVMSKVLKEKKITRDMITAEIVDSFIYRIIVVDKHEIFFVIDINHKYSLKELVENRKEILKMKPIYENKVAIRRIRKEEKLTYKVVTI